MSGESIVSSYQYTGLGDRISQTVNGVTTNYTLDLNPSTSLMAGSGLTQALSDGTNAYVYGAGRVAQVNTTTEYFLGDALGSVRQLTNSQGNIILAKSYDPYGTASQSVGSGESIYAYTGEQVDASGLVYLRARYYASGIGGFLTKDPSGAEANLYLYAGANPINMKDPTGLFASPGAGLVQFAACFSLHTGNLGNSLMPARAAVDLCKEGFSQDIWNRSFFHLGGDLPTTAHDLFGRYLFEGKESHLDFNANEPLTQELSKAIFIHQLRDKYYSEGDSPATPGQYYFNVPQFFGCFGDALTNEQKFRTIPLTCLMGSFYYQIKTDGDYVGFRIDNRTDLGSGTHIPLRFDGGQYGGSVEELLDNGDISDWTPLFVAVNKLYHGQKVVTILKPRDRNLTGEWTNWAHQSHILGGGNLVQTYVWKEKRDPCWKFPYNILLGPPHIYPWDNYRDHTAPIPEFRETY